MKARTLCAHLAGVLRQPPGHQSACGCLGRDTGKKPGPEAPSPARPAGTAPHGALEAACHQRKCRWSCCNICSKKRWTHSVIRCLCISQQRCGLIDCSGSSCLQLFGLLTQTHSKALVLLLPTECKTTAALTRLEHCCPSAKKHFDQ